MSGPRRTLFEFKPGRYFAAIAFVYGRNDWDWLGAVWRDLPDGRWHFDARIRGYVDEKAHGSADPRSSFETELSEDATEAEALAVLRAAGQQLVAAGFNDRIDVVEMKSDDPRVCARKLMARPWCHMQKAPS